MIVDIDISLFLRHPISKLLVLIVLFLLDYADWIISEIL